MRQVGSFLDLTVCICVGQVGYFVDPTECIYSGQLGYFVDLTECIYMCQVGYIVDLTERLPMRQVDYLLDVTEASGYNGDLFVIGKIARGLLRCRGHCGHLLLYRQVDRLLPAPPASAHDARRKGRALRAPAFFHA